MGRKSYPKWKTQGEPPLTSEQELVLSCKTRRLRRVRPKDPGRRRVNQR